MKKESERLLTHSVVVCEFPRTWERLDKRLDIEVRADTLADYRTKNRTVAIHEAMCRMLFQYATRKSRT